jgi:hypothetical protein
MKIAKIMSAIAAAAAISGSIMPAQAIVKCASGTKALNSTLSLACPGTNFSSAHLGSSAPKFVRVRLVSGAGGDARVWGIGSDGTATKIPECFARDLTPDGNAVTSATGGCDGTEHPLATILGHLYKP